MKRGELDLSKISGQLALRAIQARRPLSCTFELTYRCNFRCQMCYIRMTDEQAAPYGRLRTVEEWIDMGKQVRDAGVLYLTLTGGECTQYPGFPRLYEALAQMGFRIHIMTNGAVCSEELKSLFRKFPPCSVSVTLYGGSNETYERVTGMKNGLDYVTDNIRFFQNHNVPVILNHTMIRQNVHDYPKVAQVAKSLGLRINVDHDMLPHSCDTSFSDVQACKLSISERVCIMFHQPEDVEKALVESRTLERDLDQFFLPQVEQGQCKQLSPCYGASIASCIFWNGNMHSCLSFAKASFKYRPFEVGFDAAWQQLQDDRDRIFQSSPQCERCALQDSCRKRCSGRHFEGTQDPQQPDLDVCRFVWLYERYKKHRSLLSNSHETPSNY